jgi:hypothetical protein
MPFFVFPFSSVATYCTYTIQSFSFLACPTGKIMKRLTMASRAYHEEEEDTTCTKTRRDLLVWTTRADRSEQITRKPISIPVRDARADLLNLKLLIKKDRKMMTSLCDRPAVLDPRSNSLVEHNSSSSQSRLIIIYSKKNKKLAAGDDVGSPPDTCAFWQKTIIRSAGTRSA